MDWKPNNNKKRLGMQSKRKTNIYKHSSSILSGRIEVDKM